MIVKIQLTFIAVAFALIMISLLMGCGERPKENFQCTNCNNDECDIMYVSPEILYIENGGIK